MTLTEIAHHPAILIFGWFAFLLLIEQFQPRFNPELVGPAGRARLARNTAMGLVNKFAIPLITVPIALFGINHALIVRPDWARGVLATVVDVLILDFASYWFHVIAHRFKPIWHFHEIHHLDRNMDASTGLRVHPAEVLMVNLFRLPVIMALGIPITSILAFEITLGVLSSFHHSNVRLPAWVEAAMGWLVMTPTQHFCHHHAIIEDTDSAFGFIFNWWDRLFGTFNRKVRTQDWEIGLEYSKERSIGELLLYPFTGRDWKAEAVASGQFDPETHAATARKG